VTDHVAQGFEALGAAILVAGIVWSFGLAVVTWRRAGQPAKAYLALRQAFGGTLLLGLEVLVAADLIRTIAVAPTLGNVLVLGLIVLMIIFPSEKQARLRLGVWPTSRVPGVGPTASWPLRSPGPGEQVPVVPLWRTRPERT